MKKSFEEAKTTFVTAAAVLTFVLSAAALGELRAAEEKAKITVKEILATKEKRDYVDPKLEVGGCFTAHNISGRRGGGIREFIEHVESLPNYETTVDRRGGGVSISYKRAEK